MTFRIVQSKQNSRLKQLRRALAQPMREAGQDRRVLVGIEGPNLVEEALRAGLRIECVFVAEGAEKLLDLIPLNPNTEMLLMPKSLLDSVLTTEAPQPIAALVVAPDWNWEDLLEGGGDGSAGQVAEGLTSEGGGGFNPRKMPAESTSALQAAEKLNALKGHDFSRAASDLESTWASAPEGCFPSITPEISTFSATCLAADGLHSPISRGIPEFSAKRKAEPLIVVLAGLQDPGNLGTILRSAEAFGASGVVSLPGTVSAWNPKAVRASAGSVFRVPLLAAGTEECFRRLRAAKVRILTTAVQGAEQVQNAGLAEAVAFLIGNEGNGVAEEIAAQADGAITIPCPGPVESLNAAVAASVLLYEAARQRGGPR